MRFVPYLFSATVKVLGYFPGNVFKFAGTEAKQQMLDWSQSGIRGVYQPLGYDDVLEPMMAKVKVPMFAMSFDGDDYAPVAAVEHLLSKMPGCQVQRQHLQGSEYPTEILHHFKWARKQVDITTKMVSDGL